MSLWHPSAETLQCQFHSVKSKVLPMPHQVLYDRAPVTSDLILLSLSPSSSPIATLASGLHIPDRSLRASAFAVHLTVSSFRFLSLLVPSSHLGPCSSVTSAEKPSLTNSSHTAPLSLSNHPTPRRQLVSFTDIPAASRSAPGALGHLGQVLSRHGWNQWIQKCCPRTTNSPVSLFPMVQCNPSPDRRAQRDSEGLRGQAPSTVAASLYRRAQADCDQTQTWSPTETKSWILG